MGVSKPSRIFAFIFCLIMALCSIAASATTYATWLMIWHGHDQGWWKPDLPPMSRIDGEWKALDWADDKQIEFYLDSVKNAGITVVIADLTNGWKWLDKRCIYIQSLCAQKGLKFCVAENSAGNVDTFENHAADIWKNFAGPDAKYHNTYLSYKGKPLIVCYAIRDWYKSYLASASPNRSRFSLVWASGEDSETDKWGWQLEPWVGSIPSADSMFVTSSVKWNSHDPSMWRKSLAWLDYNFAIAKKKRPAHIIVGSFDDPTERNGWLVSDTSKCEPGRQMRDKVGALSTDAYYNRVCQWISGKPASEPGGTVKDGAYRLINRATGQYLGIPDSDRNAPGTPATPLLGISTAAAPAGLYWFYHLGSNKYRIIALQSGLALEAEEAGNVIQNWDSQSLRQRWILRRAKEGYFTIKNESAGKLLTLDQSGTVQPRNNTKNQEWKLEAEVTL